MKIVFSEFYKRCWTFSNSVKCILVYLRKLWLVFLLLYKSKLGQIIPRKKRLLYWWLVHLCTFGVYLYISYLHYLYIADGEIHNTEHKSPWNLSQSFSISIKSWKNTRLGLASHLLYGRGQWFQKAFISSWKYSPLTNTGERTIRKLKLLAVILTIFNLFPNFYKCLYRK